jgi:transcriptional regulator GlxA family with amidase domain
MERRATTHSKSLQLLEAYGASPARGRVVDEGQIVTAGGVSCALDLGLHLLARYVDDDAVREIATQMALLED